MVTALQTWQQPYADCLLKARLLGLDCIRFLQAGPAIDDPSTAWLVTQAATGTIPHFANERPRHPSVGFAYDSLLNADVMQTVCRHVLAIASAPREQKDEGSAQEAIQSVQPLEGASDWCEVKRVLKRRKRTGRTSSLYSEKEQTKRLG